MRNFKDWFQESKIAYEDMPLRFPSHVPVSAEILSLQPLLPSPTSRAGLLTFLSKTDRLLHFARPLLKVGC